MKTGILWDLDGTLLDTLEDLADAVNFALGEFGYPTRSVEEVRCFVGNGARRLIELSLPGREDDPDVDEALAYYQQYYKAHSRVKTKPYPGVFEALTAIRAKYPVAIVSNKPDAATKALCKEYFGDVYARGESSDCPRKPAPDMLHRAMDAIGVDSCIYVGDSEVDVLTAQNAGAKCLSVLWGFRDQELLKQAGGTNFCSEPSKLLQELEQML